MDQPRKRARAAGRRTFLKAAAGITAGTVLGDGTGWGQAPPAFPKIHAPFLITPDQAWDWNVFKSRGGPTYAGGAGWKRYTDFLISKMQEFGAVDLDYVDIPYDHYIVDDWPDRRTHLHDSAVALEKLVTDGTP